MKFSTKSEYGLRAIVHLDKNGENPVSLAMIAKEEGLSLAYLERLFAQLKKAELIRADLGAKGGYYLTRPAKEISVLEMIEALDGSVAPFSCADKGIHCNSKKCKIHPVWAKLYSQIRKTLGEISLAELI
ncbi:Rrf2 family transcriptional regulator [Patescibacteria group bacterium]|nr:Rrf2 family transcriptional regulator [Patescibacteria group bacterium]